MRGTTTRGADLQSQVIMVTGSAGLIGRALVPRLTRAGARVIPFDLRHAAMAGQGDIRDYDAVRAAMAKATGVVHLAGVSRVVTGEADPAACWSVNVDATNNLLETAAASSRKPWMIYASSREVYGQQTSFPVSEDAAKRPLNVYARSKIAAEGRVEQACLAGVKASVVRFSSVYGDIEDHADRVTPAFARTAAMHGTLRIDGHDTMFDLTHVDDVSQAVMLAIAAMAEPGPPLPPLHFVSGEPTSLEDLAKLAIATAGGGTIRHAAARSFDVHRFLGDPTRALSVLGWRATTPLPEGMARLVAAFVAAERSEPQAAAL